MVFGHKKNTDVPATSSTHQAGVAPSETATVHNNNTSVAAPATRGKGGIGGHEKFSFGKWIKLWGPDLLTMAAMGALGLGLYESPPAPSRSFPVYFANGEVVIPDYAYPLRKEVIPILAAAALAFLVPFVFIALFQIRHKSIHMLTATTMALVQSLITAAVFQVFLKTLIGGFRPHFLAVCKPNLVQGAAPTGNGFGNLFYQRDICTGDDKEINDALESFPSGHSTAAAAGFVFLSLYINAQLKCLSDYRPAYWKQIAFFAPLLGTVLIAGALTIDKYHHAHDTIAGVIIGTATAFFSYRQCFAAIWDFRFNHILLQKNRSAFLRHPVEGDFVRFDYQLGGTTPALSGAHGAGAHHDGLGANSEKMGEHKTTGRGYDAPFSREGGWGHGVPVQGAPGDALPSAISSFGGGGRGGAVGGAMEMAGRAVNGGHHDQHQGGVLGHEQQQHHHQGGVLGHDHHNQQQQQQLLPNGEAPLRV